MSQVIVEVRANGRPVPFTMVGDRLEIHDMIPNVTYEIKYKSASTEERGWSESEMKRLLVKRPSGFRGNSVSKYDPNPRRSLQRR